MVIINKESEIWTKIIKPKYPLYCQRLECKGVGEGIPDIMLIKKDTRNLFVEAKFVDNLILKKNNLKEIFYYVKPKVRPSQIRWFLKYPNEACFIIGIKSIQKFAIIDKSFVYTLLNDSEGYLVLPEELLTAEEMLKKLLNYVCE